MFVLVLVVLVLLNAISLFFSISIHRFPRVPLKMHMKEKEFVGKLQINFPKKSNVLGVGWVVHNLVLYGPLR